MLTMARAAQIPPRSSTAPAAPTRAGIADDRLLGDIRHLIETVLIEAVARTHTRRLADCGMRPHWHLVVWPKEDRELSQFVDWLTLTPTQRWRADRQSTGSGHVEQGRFKSFPLQDDDHLFTVARYAAMRISILKDEELGH